MSRGTPDRTDKRVRRQNNLVCKSHSQKSGRTLNMKLSVRVRGDWIAVPCKGNEKISWFGEETLRRYYKAKAKHVDSQTEKVFEVRKAKGGAILDKDDSVKDVLDDNDFVTVGKTILFTIVSSRESKECLPSGQGPDFFLSSIGPFNSLPLGKFSCLFVVC